MVVENAVEGSGTFFGEFTPFRVEFTRVVRTLARSIRPALDIGEPFFQSSPFRGPPLNSPQAFSHTHDSYQWIDHK
jgi:hypothetical protein